MQYSTVDASNSHEVAQTSSALSKQPSTSELDGLDDSEFKTRKAFDFPENPGEYHRNRALPRSAPEWFKYDITESLEIQRQIASAAIRDYLDLYKDCIFDLYANGVEFGEIHAALFRWLELRARSVSETVQATSHAF
jgi:hypothetical protein